MTEEQMRAQMAEMQQTILMQQALINQRAEPLLTAVIDALSNTAQMAAQGHPGARAILNAWFRSQEQAKAARGGLMVVSKNGG